MHLDPSNQLLTYFRASGHKMALRNLATSVENQAYVALLYSYLRQCYKALHAIDKLLDSSTRVHNDTGELEHLETEWRTEYHRLKTYCADMPDSVEENKRVAQLTGARIYLLLQGLRIARMNFMRTTLRVGLEQAQSNTKQSRH